MSTTAHHINDTPLSPDALLGGKQVLRAEPESTLEWISLVRQGLPSGSIDAILRQTRISQAELAATLAIPERTLARRKREGNLTPEESAKLLRFARVVSRGEEVFEHAGAALDWLKAPNRALGKVTPLSLLDTEIGAEMVLDTLGRIEHGVFA